MGFFHLASIFFSFIVCFYSAESSFKYSTSNTMFFHDQLVDHFDALNTKRWNQTYLIHTPMTNNVSEFPVLVLEGEWEINDEFCYFHKYLPDFPATIFTLSHRYYEEEYTNANPTYPFKPSTDSRLFSSKQALADAAYFVQKVVLEQEGFKKLPILFGCSYAGSMATWFRQRYPHLSTGAISLSGPLRAENVYEIPAKNLAQTILMPQRENWDWQVCTEFGWYRDIHDCKVWGITDALRKTLIERTNILYGTTNITTLNNMLILNGQLDNLWARYSMPNYGNNYSGLFSRIIPNCGHCLGQCTEENFEGAKKFAKEAVMTWTK